MPASADEAPELQAVVREVGELESLCNALETSLVAGDWNAVAVALRDSRRVTHAFLNAMDAAAGSRDEAFDNAIHARMRRVFDVREDQLARLQVFHEQVGERLQTISRWKAFARSFGGKTTAPRRSVGLDSTR